jgi:translation initiation factor eIF-2B subunit epsilon
MLKLLYDEDVVAEEAVLEWADEKAHADDSERHFLNLAAPFVEWLRNASEEDSDSDEEEGSDDDA